MKYINNAFLYRTIISTDRIENTLVTILYAFRLTLTNIKYDGY